MKLKIISTTVLLMTFLCSSIDAQVLTVYKDYNYGGTTQSFDVGFHKGYFKIGNDVISSLKIKPGYSVTLYENGEGTGRELVLTSDTPNLGKFKFNDIASNLKVEKTSVLTVYKDYNYRGTTQSFNEGFHKGYFKIGNDVISSLKISPGYSVTLYENGVGTGRELVLYSDTPNLGDLKFNDIASNLKVEKVGNSLSAGKTLLTGQRLYSENGAYYLVMQTDGNLCIYSAKNGFKWCSMAHGFKGAKLIMQSDGNLVVYDGANASKWDSETTGFFNPKWKKSSYKPVKLVLENDGVIKLYNAAGKSVWQNQ